MLSLGAPSKGKNLEKRVQSRMFEISKKINNRKTGMICVNALNLELHQIKINMKYNGLTKTENLCCGETLSVTGSLGMMD